jgi:hypothetical protein
MKVKAWHITLVLVLLAGILAGCGTAFTGSEVEAGVIQAESGGSEAESSTALNQSYEGALPASSQLVLGTFLLEGTETAVTSEQARTLLPLWQVIESGSLKSESETATVLKQIEGAMNPEQLATIAAMQLTSEDIGAWAREQGVSLGGPADGAGGFAPPSGMSQEEMEAMRATAEASGMTHPNGAGGMGAGQISALAGPLVELLSNLTGG